MRRARFVFAVDVYASSAGVTVLVEPSQRGAMASRGRGRWLSQAFVYLVPPTLLFLSLSRLVVAVHLQDNTWSLVLGYPTITIPVS